MGSRTAAVQQLLQVFHRLNISFLLGGSVASSVHGISRATMDVDLVADLQERHVAPLVAELSKDFYIDAEMIREALRSRRPFNLIHYKSSYKFDVFPLSSDPYYQTEFRRKRTMQFSLDGTQTLESEIATAEDTILTKLAWYRHGGEVSDRQWNDIRGVVAVQGPRLDREYMLKWARHLGVEDLLERALREQSPSG